ncbi:hypothetical protein K6119_19175 [Paracrocinitomix mangrovi]|uniref:hypothetical protein n=1 Tax=Paracrocinitomix mangrovi TaxID=2862509 RepID=UPI001C8D6E0B|nr:hypothetical protein [Paracrocinitomix mangrovi]UKN01848.1 hypothetical protein K6119_19175 [Paracrocinitomix mangrovi]
MTKIRNIKSVLPEFTSGTYLVLVNPENIPHLVLLHQGKYYSLTYEGVEVGKDFGPYFEKLKRLNKKILFVTIDGLKKDPENVFSKYLFASKEEASCLSPIKELLLEDSNANLIFELMPELYAQKMIGDTFQIGMHDLIEDGQFNMSKYSKTDVDNYIQSLRNKYVER